MPVDFPFADRNHEISNASKLMVDLLRPSSWQLDAIEGDNDFGFDAQVQVAMGGQICYAFRAQIKGTESPSISENGTTLSIALKRTTLNLYANTSDEVMLLVAVVSLQSNGKPDTSKSQVYWQWISNELIRLRGSRVSIDRSDQQTVTLHVPLVNVLTPDTDVTGYLEARQQTARALERLEDIVRETAGGPQDSSSALIERLISAALKRPEHLAALLVGAEFSTASAVTDGSPEALAAEALSYIRAGNTTLAEAFIARLDPTAFEATPARKALYLSLQGKVAMQRMRRSEALRLFAAAYDADPSERHLLPREEVRFLFAVDSGDKDSIREISDSLASATSDDGLALRVRVHVSIGEFDLAQACVEGIGAAKQLMPRLVVLSGLGRWQEVRTLAEQAAVAPGISIQDIVATQLVAARACWQQALSTANVAPDAHELPLTGAPGLDPEAALAAWSLSEACLRGLKDLGWSPNVELLAPIAVASAAAVGRHQEALALLREAAAARPEYPDLQENLELLAIGAGEQDIALEANARRPRHHEALVRRACMLFQTKRYQECVTTALDALATMVDVCKQTPMALAVGSAAAVRLARVGDSEKLLQALRSRPEWTEFEYFARFAMAGASAEGAARDLNALREGLIAAPSSWLLAANLYSNLNVEDLAEAKEAIALARILRSNASLSTTEWLHLITAHFTLKQWQEAELEARAAIARYGETDRFVSCLAVAAEMQGNSGEAVRALERSVALGHRRSVTLRNYLGLCLRLGRMKTARETIEQLLVTETDRSERLELLRLNALILSQQGLSAEALDMVNEIGRTVAPDQELEEGMYLNLYMAVTMQGANPADAEKAAFWRRVDAFCLTWPESALFRRSTLPEAEVATVDSLHAMLDPIVGDSRKRLQEYQERERKARDGELQVPFIARPGFVLHYIGDPFMLWEVSKSSSFADRQFHLICSLTDEPVVSSRALRDVPLLDLTALLVLNDLGLFELLFAMYSRVAVPRRTVDYISQHARGVFIHARVSQLAEGLLSIINKYLDRIDQPSGDVVIAKSVRAQDALNDYVQLAATGRWTVYSDDVFTRVWVRSDNDSVGAMSTVDLLRLADDAEQILPRVVAAHLSVLVNWNVGITITGRHLIASLDGALPSHAKLSAEDRLDCFQRHQPFTLLARAIWRPDRPASELIGHVAAIMSEILIRPATEVESAAALWAFWYIRLRLLSPFNQMGWDLLCYSLLMILKQLPLQASSRVVGVFLMTVELAAGRGLMTREIQVAAIGRLGACAGSLAHRDLTLGETLRQKVAAGLAAGTHDGDIFDNAYWEAQRDKNRATR
jgi:tetratricopeptide (TPR) repeat protein